MLSGAAISSDPFVIALSGTSGSGKSTLIDRLVECLGGAVGLHFDAYIVLGSDVGEIGEWLADGADPNRVRTPEFAEDVRALVAGGATVSRPDYVILEEPFGRARDEMAPLIDFAIHLDVPLDVALGRRLLRAIEAEDVPHAAVLSDIADQMRAFLGGGREAYRAIDETARAAADLVLDGLLPPDDLVAPILCELTKRRGR